MCRRGCLSCRGIEGGGTAFWYGIPSSVISAAAVSEHAGLIRSQTVHTVIRFYIGGRWGKKVAMGRALNQFFTTKEEVMTVIEKAILFFKGSWTAWGERFADTIARLGFENVEKQLLS